MGLSGHAERPLSQGRPHHRPAKDPARSCSAKRTVFAGDRVLFAEQLSRSAEFRDLVNADVSAGLIAPVLSHIASALVWTGAAVFLVGVVLLATVLLIRPRPSESLNLSG